MTLTFAEKLGVNVLLLPMGRADDGAQYVPFRPPRLGRSRKPVVINVAQQTKSWTCPTLSKGWVWLLCVPVQFLMTVLSDQGPRDILV